MQRQNSSKNQRTKSGKKPHLTKPISQFIIPTIRAGHLVRNMKVTHRSGWEIVRPLGNKDGQRFFPGDEVYVRIPEKVLKPQNRVVIIHSGAPDPNGGLVELEMALSVLKKAGVEVKIFFAYFPYGRQDHAFHPGETNAAKDLVEKLVGYYGVKHIYVLDAHFAGQSWVNEYPMTLVSTLSLLKKAAKKDYPHVTYKVPDAGGQRRTKLKGTKKIRMDSVHTSIESDESFCRAVSGKVIGAVDDLVGTGGTLAGFAEVCEKCGALGQVALLSHGVLVEGIKRLQIVFSKVYLTNSIDRGEDSNVDVTDLIWKVIRGVNR